MGKAEDVIEKGNTYNEFRLFSLQLCFDYYQNFADRLINRLNPKNNTFNRKRTNDLSFGYLWKDIVNAGSLEKVDEDILVVNEGTILKIYSLFYKLNTRINILPLNGEKVSHIEIMARIFYTNKVKPTEPINFDMVFSDNEIINNIAEYMSMFAIKFLIAHEIGHIYNGHTELYLKTRKRICLEKKNSNNTGILEKMYLDLQTMEWDADAFGICRVIDDTMDLYRNSDKICSILSNSYDLFKLVVYTIHGVFYLCRDANISGYKYAEHPPSFVREVCIIDTIKHYLKKQYNLECDNSLLLDDWGRIESYYNLANKVDESLNNDYRNYIVKFSHEAAAYSIKLRDNYFNNLCHLLKPTTRLPIEGIDY